MEKHNVKDMEGALILISCQTHDIDDKSTKYHRVLPHTIREGKFRLFELDGQKEGINRYFPMAKYEQTPLWSIDLDNFDTVEEVAQHILRTDGKKIINAFYCDEEVVIDNKLTITIHNYDRKEIYSTSKVFKIVRSEPSDETTLDTETILRALDTTFAEDEKIFIHDRRVVLRHLILFIIIDIAVAIMGRRAGWSLSGSWIVATIASLYLTQLWWCNIPHKSLGSRLWNETERRAKGRPWINGGAFAGVGLAVVMFAVDKLCGVSNSFTHYFLFFLATALCVTFVILTTKKGTNGINDSTPQHKATPLGDTLYKQQKRMRRAFWKEFFLRILPWNW